MGILRDRTAVIVVAIALLGTAVFARSLPRSAGAAPAPSGASSAFDAHWQDGKGELNGYRFSITRYGALRQGTAVMVYVTEPFSTTKMVKVNDPKKYPGGTYEALKLNFIRDFQTGIYDYNTMVSVFVRSRDFSPVKTVFSCMEWCGEVFEEMIYEPHHIANRTTSYFEDESSTQRLRRFDDEVAEENLYVLLRGLRGDYLRPGERRRVHFLPGAFYRRLTHQPFVWSAAVIEREPAAQAVSVPAGSFDATVYVVRVDGGREGRFWIESAYPHRIVRWAWKSNAAPKGRGWSPSEATDSGELAGSARLAYWTLNHPGDEQYLKMLGLAPASGSGKSRGGGTAKPSAR